jgi:Flp pilus assembly pilin Flp
VNGVRILSSLTRPGGQPDRPERQESGQALVEYALVLLFVAIVIAVSLQLFAGALTSTFADIANGWP